jgi:hypothetical protein
MRVVLVGAELEENIGVRYMASALEANGHAADIVPFNSGRDAAGTVRQTLALEPAIVGLSMVFTSPGREFCRLAADLRDAGFTGHLVAGSHFAALSAERLLADWPAFDSISLGEGEGIITDLAANPDHPARVAGLCFRAPDGAIVRTPTRGNLDNLEALPFPKRTAFHRYFDNPIAGILSSSGCWRDCTFCSINAWCTSGGGHCEDTGACELIRRRVGFILVCDAGCDPKYAFQDLANLVRKSRTDFDAEVVFYDRRQLDVLLPQTLRPYFGTMDDIRRLHVGPDAPDGPPKEPCPHALLAAVFYDDPGREKRAPDSVMVVLKPGYSGNQPLDVVDYRRSHPRFPQEPTSDQFFDEAQWESYRRLGEHVASRVFGFAGDDDGTGSGSRWI